MNESQVFADALNLADPAERAAYLDRVCAGDAQMRADVEALLHAQAAKPDFLEQPVAALGATVDAAAAAATAGEPTDSGQAGMILAGRYKLLEAIGEGGMGTVWMAQQTEPVKRLVAVKLIKAGMDSRQVIARFEAERQALALMDHPNIARVLDAGATDSGRPYFVMDLVKGVPITRYCDEHRLTPRQRLELFLPVCQAVQHAHQKGIIHRDLKPSNVLVALYDGMPVPKVIDFGVAKAAGQSLTDTTLVTGFGAIVGTLEYMSPEQAEINQLDIDTRSDIYSLGVLLYELLTGGPPFSRQQLEKAGMLEMLRVIREQEPSRPSAKLSTAEGLPTLAANRGTEPAKLARLLRGELDWIVMKALEKDRGRRYETANGFAMDVQRYLADEPVLACPPSPGYRLRKFIRRNRGPVVAAAIILLLLVGGIVGTTTGLIQARAATEQERLARGREAGQRHQAETQKQIAEANEKTAVAEKQIAEAVRTFLLEDLLLQADPYVQADTVQRLGGGFELIENPTIKELLDRAAAGLTPTKIEQRFPGQRAVQASILRTVGDAYRGVGDFAKGADFLARAHDIFRDELGADDPETLRTMNNLASAYRSAGKLPQAIELFEKVRDTQEKRLGPDNLDTLTTLFRLAGAYREARKTNEAVDLFEKVYRGRRIQLGPTNPRTLSAMNSLALAYRTAKRTPEAVTLYEKVRTAREKELGPDHVDTLTTLNNLALAYAATGKGPEAILLLEKARDGRAKKLGPYHPDTLVTFSNLARMYQDVGEPTKALPLFQHAAAGVEKLQFKLRYADLTLNDLCQCYELLGKYDQAELWRRKLLTLAREKTGPESREYARELYDLGSNLLAQKKHVDAESTLRQCLTIIEKTHPEAWTTFNAKSMLGGSLLGQGKYTDAEPLLQIGYAGINQRAAQIAPEFRNRLTEAVERLVQLYDATKRPDDAAKWRKELEALRKAKPAKANEK